MKQMTLQEIFKKAICCSAASLLENPAPGPLLDVHLNLMNMTMATLIYPFLQDPQAAHLVWIFIHFTGNVT